MIYYILLFKNCKSIYINKIIKVYIKIKIYKIKLIIIIMLDYVVILNSGGLVYYEKNYLKSENLN